MASSIWTACLRLTTRLLSFGGFVLRALMGYLTLRMGGPISDSERRSWMQVNAQRLADVLHIEVRTQGTVPSEGLLAANHLSYLDIVVLASIAPSIFVSKSEVRFWPVIGLLSNLAGTLYLKRGRRSDVARIGKQIATRLKEGQRIVVFPEGTSSDGSQILPFHSSLFFPAISAKRSVVPCHIRYQEPGNNPGQVVCYWGDMLFLTHFLKLLTVESIQADLTFGTPIHGLQDRKSLARETWAQVKNLADLRRF